MSIEINSRHHAENLSSKHSYTLNAKFTYLLDSSSSLSRTDLSIVKQNAVINLSGKDISETQYSVLKFYSSFAISRKASFPQLIAPIEKTFKNSHLTETQKENLRHLIMVKN